jgi:hypothetical protein
VGLVEAVALEGFEGLEHRVDDARLDAALRGLGDELLLLGAKHGRLLLADRVAERVGLGAGEAAERDRGGHDVLLVDEDPVGLVEVRLEQRVEVGDPLLPVLAADVRRNVVHRAGAVQRDHCGKVVDRCRAQLADVAAHPRRLQLEDAGRLTRRQQLEGASVVERDRVEVDCLAPVRADQVHCLAQDRQVRQSEEVELQQPQRLDRMHLVLGHQRVGVRRLLERHELRQRLAADDHPSRMRRRIAGHALELLGELDDPLHRRVRVVLLPKLRRCFERLVEPDPELVRDRLGDAVDLAVAVAEHPPDVADRGAGEHRAERDDLGDVVLAVLRGRRRR